MTTEHFNYLKQTVQSDLNMYLNAMINSGKFSVHEIRDIGAYVGAHYTHFANANNLSMNENEKIALMNFIASIYSRFSKNGFSIEEQKKQNEKYNELLKEDSKIIEAKLQSITNLFIG